MDQKSVVFNLAKLAIVTAALPLMAFIFCISLSLISNFNESTSTHCKVKNYLPSISASIGNFFPTEIWVCIALHSSPRYFISYIHYTFWHNNSLALLFNIIEISSLIGLSFISSIENFPVHSQFFTMFILTSFIYMLIILKQHRLRHRKEIRLYCAISNLVAGLFAVYLYYRHNLYCEPGVYSLFSFMEYIVVISNIVFHFQTYYDLQKTQAILIEKSSSISSTDSKIDFDDRVHLI